jgi:hypothetical protein
MKEQPPRKNNTIAGKFPRIEPQQGSNQKISGIADGEYLYC